MSDSPSQFAPYQIGNDPLAAGLRLPTINQTGQNIMNSISPSIYSWYQGLPTLNQTTGQIVPPAQGEQSGGTFAMFDFFKKITSGDFWQQFGIVVIGIAVLLVALYMFSTGKIQTLVEGK